MASPESEAPPPEPNLRAGSINHLGWKVWYKQLGDPSEKLPSDEKNEFMWIDLQVSYMIDGVRMFLLGGVIMYTLITYWAGVLGWAETAVDSKESALTVSIIAYAILWIPSILQYTQFAVMLIQAKSLGKTKKKKGRTFKLHEWLHDKVYKNCKPVSVPIGHSVASFQQLSQSLVQNIPFLLINVILPLLFPYFNWDSASVGERAVMKICPAVLAFGFALMQYLGMCPSRTWPYTFLAGGVLTGVLPALEQKFGGIEIVKFSASAGGPYFEFVDGKIYLSPGWTEEKCKKMSAEAMKTKRGRIFPLTFVVCATTPFWLWSIDGRAWVVVGITLATTLIFLLPQAVFVDNVALKRAVQKRKELDEATVVAEPGGATSEPTGDANEPTAMKDNAKTVRKKTLV